MGETRLGDLPQPNQGRDAVHVAVVAVRAGEDLVSGDPVKLNPAGEAVHSEYAGAVGVVDPFLVGPSVAVRKGNWFWLCLYPGTITGLRHVWEHPQFKSESPPAVQEAQKLAESERWLREYVKRYCPYYEEGGYEEFMGFVREEKLIYYYGTDCHGLEGVKDAEELFRHLSVILGFTVTASYFEGFACSC